MTKIEHVNQIGAALMQVIDPELNLNIMDLGLVYDAQFDNEKQVIKITMTMTTQGCPMVEVIQRDVSQVLAEKFPGFIPEIHLVWEPPWHPGLISAEGKKQLNS